MGTVSVDGQPLLFTHFSGWSIDEPELVSRHSPHYSQPPNIPGWEKMGLEYRDRLLENGYAEKITGSYGFARFSDGQEITYDQRRLYYNDVRNGQCPVDQPFQHPERFENRPLKTIEGVAFMGQELARTHRALTETQRQLASTQQQLNDSQQQLNDSQQQLNDSQQQLNDSQMTCSTLGQQVTLDQSQREGLAQQVLELNHQLTEATQNYSQLQVQHGETMGQLQARIQHIEDLQRQTTDQMQQIALMERSKFWKVGTLWYTCLHRIKQKLKT
jgi:DNA repair exonuclease SbcCD ATPase subunit